MTIKLTWCPACRCYWVRDGNFFSTSCGHPRREMVAVTAERVGCYEHIHLRLGGCSGEANASGWILPDGNGDMNVQYKGRCLMKLADWKALLADKSPAMLEAFERRWDGALVRRAVA